jgi:MFS superfamily sulfate permease-like transporter
MSLRAIHQHNLSTFREQPLAEISGSLGDLGTFLPIVIALTEGHQISLATTLIFTGLFNIVTGICFGIPLPVQPMKAIAAVALLKSLSAGEVAAAGLFVAGCILILSVTGLLTWITRVVPIPVVKGIQVGAGLSLIISAGTKVLADLRWTSPSWADNYIWVVVVFLALLVSSRIPRTPYALIVLIIGLIFAGIQLGGSGPGFRAWHPYTQVPHGNDWHNGILQAGIGQLPLTTLNSIVAVTHLAADILPEVATPSVTAIGLSVAGMNLFGIWFGSMPVCHGSGGLAAQYRFGARSGASIIFLGILKLIIGLLFGESLTGLLKSFPTAFLAVMIIAAGLELASVGESLNTNRARDLREHKNRDSSIEEAERKQRWTIMLVTAGMLVAFKNDAVGFMAGLCCHWSYILPDYVVGLRRRQKSNGIRLGSSSDNEALLTQEH